MSNTIEKIKPSKTNPFEGEFDGSEIVLVTRPKIGTYKATMAQLRDFYSIEAMTEDELNNIQNPQEGKFYATFEE